MPASASSNGSVVKPPSSLNLNGNSKDGIDSRSRSSLLNRSLSRERPPSLSPSHFSPTAAGSSRSSSVNRRRSPGRPFSPIPPQQRIQPALYTTGLVYAACQILFISFICSYHNVGVGNITTWLIDALDESPFTAHHMESVRHFMQTTFQFGSKARAAAADGKRRLQEGKTFDPVVPIGKEFAVFTPEQLSLFDGSRSSRPVYLAIVGRVYDVDRGKKHYGKGGGYSFFAGRDATRAFVTGDFTEEGLVDDVEGLAHEDILAIRDWVSFYEKDYSLVGVVSGRYYDTNGEPTDETRNFLDRVTAASEWRASRAAEAEVFPPCNSEWHKDSGGRVWCTPRSGGIERLWAGLPRLYNDPATKQARCACVKNFGDGLSAFAHGKSENRGDLDHPALELYPGCKETSNSCKIEDD